MIDDLIIKLLSEGKTQMEISEVLQTQKINPNSVSFIEKRLKAIKIKYKATTLFHLAVMIYGTKPRVKP